MVMTWHYSTLSSSYGNVLTLLDTFLFNETSFLDRRHYLTLYSSTRRHSRRRVMTRHYPTLYESSRTIQSYNESNSPIAIERNRTDNGTRKGKPAWRVGRNCDGTGPFSLNDCFTSPKIEFIQNPAGFSSFIQPSVAIFTIVKFSIFSEVRKP